VFIHYFDVSFMVEDVLKRPFITVGMTTFLILLVLAITSNRFSIRKLGRKWGSLHKLVYVAAIGGTLHFWQLVKADTTEPWRWAAGFALLFGFRLFWAYKPRLAASRSAPQSRIPNPESRS
jgi:sulfoxide reductase heme-binding subunit YedZ